MFPRDSRGRIVPSALMTSADLRNHFLERLLASGTVAYAAQEIGLSVSTLYRARRRFPDFAAGWDAVAGQAPRQARGRAPWTVDERAAFLDVIAEAGSPAQAAARAGQPLGSAYRLRGESADFAQRWDDAQEQALDLIESAVKQRALHGVRKTVRRGDELTETIEFSERLAIFLLKALRPKTYDAGRRIVPDADAEPLLPRADLLARFTWLTRRLAPQPAEPLELAADSHAVTANGGMETDAEAGASRPDASMLHDPAIATKYAEEAGW